MSPSLKRRIFVYERGKHYKTTIISTSQSLSLLKLMKHNNTTSKWWKKLVGCSYYFQQHHKWASSNIPIFCITSIIVFKELNHHKRVVVSMRIFVYLYYYLNTSYQVILLSYTVRLFSEYIIPHASTNRFKPFQRYYVYFDDRWCTISSTLMIDSVSIGSNSFKDITSTLMIDNVQYRFVILLHKHINKQNAKDKIQVTDRYMNMHFLLHNLPFIQSCKWKEENRVEWIK